MGWIQPNISPLSVVRAPFVVPKGANGMLVQQVTVARARLGLQYDSASQLDVGGRAVASDCRHSDPKRVWYQGNAKPFYNQVTPR
jgi:hypothetical protein